MTVKEGQGPGGERPGRWARPQARKPGRAAGKAGKRRLPAEAFTSGVISAFWRKRQIVYIRLQYLESGRLRRKCAGGVENGSGRFTVVYRLAADLASNAQNQRQEADKVKAGFGVLAYALRPGIFTGKMAKMEAAPALERAIFGGFWRFTKGKFNHLAWRSGRRHKAARWRPFNPTGA